MRYIFLISLACLLLGCSGGGVSDSPVMPDSGSSLSGPRESLEIVTGLPDGSDWKLVDAWSLTFYRETGELVPLRTSTAWWEVKNFLLPPECDYCLEFSGTHWDELTGRLDFTVTVTNPTGLTVFVPRAVLLFPDESFVLVQPDGYHAWYEDGVGPDLDPVRNLQDSGDPVEGHSEISRDWTIFLPNGAGDIVEIDYLIETSWPSEPVEPWRIREDLQHGPIGQLVIDGTGTYEYFIEVRDFQDDVTAVYVDASAFGLGVVALTESMQYEDVWEGQFTNPNGAGVGKYRLLVSVETSTGDPGFYGYLDVAVGDEGIPINPQLELVWNIVPDYPPYPGYPVYVNGTTLWAYFYNEGWMAFDISDPSDPKPMGSHMELIKGLYPGAGSTTWVVGPGFGMFTGQLSEITLDTRTYFYDLSVDPFPDLYNWASINGGPPGTGFNGGIYERIFGTTLAMRAGSSGQYDQFYYVLLDCSDPYNPVYTDIASVTYDHSDYVLDANEDWFVLMGYEDTFESNVIEIFRRPVSIEDEPEYQIVMDQPNWRRWAKVYNDVLFLSDTEADVLRWHYTELDGWQEIEPFNVFPKGEGYILGDGKLRENGYYYLPGYDPSHNQATVILDISDPLDPAIVDIYWDGNGLNDWYYASTPEITGDLFISANGKWGAIYPETFGAVVIADSDDLSNIIGVIDYYDDSHSQAVDASGDIVAIAENNMGILIADISNLPDPPEQYTWVQTSGKARDIRLYEASGGLVAYSATEGTGVEIFDLADPFSPLKIGELAYTAIRTIDLRNNTFAAAGDDGIMVWELTDPYSPTHLGTVNPLDGSDGPTWDVEIYQDALWARNNYSLTRYDLNSGWPPTSQTRTGLDASGGWIDVNSPYILDRNDSLPGLYPEYTVKFDVDNWLTDDPFIVYAFAFRKIINGSYLYVPKGKLGGSNWGELAIFDLNELPEVPDFGWWMSLVDIPRAFDWDANYTNGQGKVIHENYYISANGALDLTIVRLW